MSNHVLDQPPVRHLLPSFPDRFSERPRLVFWETTKACALNCIQCRAHASLQNIPGELDLEEGFDLLDQIVEFGKPYPIVVLTGGDCLQRSHMFELIERAVSLGLHVGLAPSVTPLLNDRAISDIVNLGVKAVSISLDGAFRRTHDRIRGDPGHFDSTITALELLKSYGLQVQVNTVAMRPNHEEMADIAILLKRLRIDTWEVFFLVPVGRGATELVLDRREMDAVCHFLYDASRMDMVIRTVEAPFFRRVVHRRLLGSRPPDSPLYQRLAGQMKRTLGAAAGTSRADIPSTRDGKGIIFVAHNGEIYPAGFLPLELGNVRSHTLVETYHNHPLLRDIRASHFRGPCSRCAYSDLCGGSRSRAYAVSGDPLDSDPACPYSGSA